MTLPSAGHTKVIREGGAGSGLAGPVCWGKREAGEEAGLVDEALRAGPVVATPSGGVTRNTCPTAMRLGLLMRFQRANSLTLRPCCLAILFKVSPRSTR